MPPQGLSLELLQWTQDGWSQTERLLTALRLQPGEGTPAALSGYLRCLPLPSPLGIFLSMDISALKMPKIQYPKCDWISQKGSMRRYAHPILYPFLCFSHPETATWTLEGLMLKLKLQYFGHLMRKANSLEETLTLGKIEGRSG